MERDKSIDLAIRYGVYDDSMENSELLITEEIGMYATPSYIEKTTNKEELNLLETKWDNKNLAEISWNTLLRDIDNHDITYKVRQFEQEHYIIQAALAGQGVALVSSLLVHNAIKQGWLIKHNLNKDLKGFSYYIVTPEYNHRSQSIMAFKSWILDELNHTSLAPSGI